MRRTLSVLAVGAAALTLVAACGDDDEGAGSPGTTAPPASTSPGDTTTAGDSSTAAVTLADSDLGRILVDAEGRTLYLFTKDSGGTSACVDACADLWPPVAAEDGATVGDGLDQSMLDDIARPDGSRQLTYAGHPLYRYAPDAAAGDTTGQGVGGVWFVVDGDGAAVQDTPTTAEPAGSAGY